MGSDRRPRSSRIYYGGKFFSYPLKPVEALPSLFRDAGYHTTAIHPFHGWYWSRDVVFFTAGALYVAKQEKEFPQAKEYFNGLKPKLKDPDKIEWIDIAHAVSPGTSR